MAVYTATLSRSYTNLATYYAAEVKYSTNSLSWSPATITPPVWKSGRKTFKGYSAPYSVATVTIVTAVGTTTNSISANVSATEQWTTLAPAAVINLNGGSGGPGEIAYADGVWYSDWASRTVFDATHPMAIPTRECYRFLGVYATNSTSGTKYVNADGTPTAAFLALAPTNDFTVYALWELSSVKVSISDSYGDWATKAVYQSKTADGDGKYGYFTDGNLTTRIYGVAVPTRECYAWGGIRSSSSTSGTLYANADGTFTADFLNLTPTTRTVYGSFWTEVSKIVTVNANGGAAAVAKYYTDKTNGGIFADSLCATAELLTLPVPVRAGYRFLGYFSATSGGTQFVSASGEILSALKNQKTADTIYAQWRKATYTIALDANGGTGGAGVIYYDATDAVWFDGSSATVTAVTPPTYTGNAFAGYYSEASGGSQLVAANGTISTAWTPTENATVYAHWTIDVSVIDVDAGEGTPVTTRFYYQGASGKFFSDPELTEEITAIAPPTLRLFEFTGMEEDGVQVIGASGVISAAWHPSGEFVTVTANYTRRCYEVVLDAAGGASAVPAVYRAPAGSAWFADDALTAPVANVGVPTRTGYTFGGYAYGGTTVVGADGAILPAAALAEDYTAAAAWTAKAYTLTFDANGGTASANYKVVTFGQPVGTLPTATWTNHQFKAWMVDGAPITAATVWEIDEGKTARAEWRSGFADLTDHCNAEGSVLMLVSSDGGESRKVTNLWNGAVEQGGKHRNPVCTYRIKAAGTVRLTLGRCYGDYFLVGVDFKSGADKEPTVTLKGMANEGQDAINAYDVVFAVRPDHVAQDPLGAVSGGGELIDCTTAFSCDAAVVYEGSEPCASDICNGRVNVSATTAAYLLEAAPTAGGGFIETSAPERGSDVDFTTYGFTAERKL